LRHAQSDDGRNARADEGLSAAPPPLKRIERGAGKGQYLLPVSQTSRPVDLDLLNNVFRAPYRQRLAIILNELGTGLAGRGDDLRTAVRNANPELKETDKVLAILSDQNKTLQNLASDGDTILAPLARDRSQVADFVVRDLVAAASGARYGRDAAVVADDRAAMLERLEAQAWSESSHEGGRSNTDPEGGRIPPASAGTVMGPPPSSDGQKRNQQRPARSSEAGRATGTPQLKLELHTHPDQAAGTGGPEHHEEGAPDEDEVP